MTYRNRQRRTGSATIAAAHARNVVVDVPKGLFIGGEVEDPARGQAIAGVAGATAEDALSASPSPSQRLRLPAVGRDLFGPVAPITTFTSVEQVVGEDVLLASCVDSPAMRYARPAMTALELSARDIGRDAARVLLRLLAGDELPPLVRRARPILCARESTRGRA